MRAMLGSPSFATLNTGAATTLLISRRQRNKIGRGREVLVYGRTPREQNPLTRSSKRKRPAAMPASWLYTG